MSAICKLVQIRVELLKLNLKSGVNPTSVSYVSLSQEAKYVTLIQFGAVGKLSCDQATNILKIVTDEPIFSQSQLSELREAVNDKLDQQVGLSNGSNTKCQKIVQPEVWLHSDLREALASRVDIGRQQKMTCRVHLLAQFFGAGGLLHPTEPTSRDIVSLALLDDADSLIISEGTVWVRKFKCAAKKDCSILQREAWQPDSRFLVAAAANGAAQAVVRETVP